MIQSVMRYYIRLIAMACLLASSLAGCARKNPTASTPTPVVTPTAVKGPPTVGPVLTTPKTTGPIPDSSLNPRPDSNPTALTHGERSDPVAKVVSAKPLDAKEQESLKDLRRRADEPWAWEPNPSYKRQRPVCLITVNADGLKHSIPTTLAYADRLAHLGWDVKFLLVAVRGERAHYEHLKDLSEGIDRINVQIIKRIQVENNLGVGVAPLATIPAPRVVESVEHLDRYQNEWLEANFLLHQEGSKSPLLSRPPFGCVAFSGHGRSLTDEQTEQFITREFLIPGVGKQPESWYAVSKVANVALKKFQAPIWIMTDICLPETSDKKRGGQEEEIAIGNIKPRDFDLTNFREMKTTLLEIEKLRGNSKAGVWRSFGAEATVLDAINEHVSLKDQPERLLHPNFSSLLKVDADNPTKFAVKDEGLHNPSSITLAEAMNWTTKKMAVVGQKPGLSKGAMSVDQVVFSTVRGENTYKPLHANLLYGGSSLLPGGFEVPELSSHLDGAKAVHYGALTVTRTADKFDGNNFKSFFHFSHPLTLSAGVKYQLILLVSASGKGKINFTVGAYDGQKLLNSNFSAYQNAESYQTPVECEKGPRLIHIPLDKNPGVPLKGEQDVTLTGFEVQATPNSNFKIVEEHWPQAALLKIHGAYLVPTDMKDDDLQSDIDRAKREAKFLSACHWDFPLHIKGETVLPIQDGTRTEFKQLKDGYTGLWGASSEIYPKRLVTKDKSQLAAKFSANGPVDEDAEVIICMYSNEQVLLAWKGSLRSAVAKENVIQLQQSGLAQDVIVAVRNHSGPIMITSMELSTTK